jgi:Na+/pantothenate symporter
MTASFIVRQVYIVVFLVRFYWNFFCDFKSFTGGLVAVIYTDTLQTIILLIGAFILMILSKLSHLFFF